MRKHRLIALYLPQFHPFKENDEWWGKGFTEWTNVTKARPRFPGHYQPHLPTDLGFYDLRIPEVRALQAQMAEEAGIYGFCYYHYWFNGHLLMERPLEEILHSGEPNFPFMICWANENWTRTWDGEEKQVLIKQDYNDEDTRNHIKWLIPYFKDPRYIRIDRKPVFAIYRQDLCPDVTHMLSIIREEAKKEGLELYICMMESFTNNGKKDLQNGFDAAIEFQPHSWRTNGFQKWYTKIFTRGINKVSRVIFKKGWLPLLISYKKYVNYLIKQPVADYKRYPCVTPMWDNSPRRKNNFFAFTGSTPKIFGKWLKSVLDKFKPYSKEENLIFINAWNEWAEGNHIEPDRKWGHQYLEQIKFQLQESEKESSNS